MGIWIKTYEEEERMVIERIKSPTKKKFYKEYYDKDKPVIFTGAIDSWEAKSLWTPDYFASKFPDVEIMVESIGLDKAGDSDYFIKNIKFVNTKMRDYVKSTQSISGKDGRRYVAQFPIAEAMPETKPHIKSFPYWSDFLYKMTDQKSLFWMGPAGCKSALHYDNEPNLNVQVYGRKRWVIYPKSENENLYLPSTLDVPHLSPININEPDFENFPKFRDAKKPIEFILEPGETLFVPQNWAHYVENLEYSISLNFWWVTWKHIVQMQIERLSSLVGKYK